MLAPRLEMLSLVKSFIEYRYDTTKAKIGYGYYQMVPQVKLMHNKSFNFQIIYSNQEEESLIGIRQKNITLA